MAGRSRELLRRGAARKLNGKEMTNAIEMRRLGLGQFVTNAYSRIAIGVKPRAGLLIKSWVLLARIWLGTYLAEFGAIPKAKR